MLPYLPRCCRRLTPSAQMNEDEPLVEVKAADREEGEAEEEECGWCKWMKAGPCPEPFQVWLDCVDGLRAKGRDDVEVCANVMAPLFECMSAHKEYYAPQLTSLAEKQEAGVDADGEKLAGTAGRTTAGTEAAAPDKAA